MGNRSDGRELRIAYVCAGGKRLGLGHISRGRALLARCTGRLIVGDGMEELSSLFPDLPLDPWSTREEPFGPEDSSADVIVVDDYELPEEWIASVSVRAPVALVDDWKRPESAAHVVINPNIGAKSRYYASRSAGSCLCGPLFAMIRPEVVSVGPGRRARPGSVLVSLGGGDSPVDLNTLLSGLRARGGRLVRSIDVVLGPASTFDATKVLVTQGVPVAVHHGPEDYASLCAESEVVVCSASTTSHEMAYLGVAFVPVVTAENQERIGRGWEEAGVAPYVSMHDPEYPEDIGRQVNSLLRDEVARKSRAAKGPGLVDGHGPDRVLRTLAALAERFGGHPA